ncbi:MAG: efflux RND transporter permease subunit, partial [Bacteroidia bacterium]|nr:efflux RND transporter permease subunit [Bacteroidia bacterium]
DGPNQIQREDAKRRIVVGFNVRGRDVQSIVHDLKEKMKTSVKLPTGYYVHYGGSFENLEAAKSRLFIAVPVSLLLIFILLFFAFNSVKQGLIIYSAIPLSAMGGVFALALRDMPFSISAGIGFIALFGVAVLNGIVLIAEFNRQKESGTASLKEQVLLGAQLRLRPVLMTAAVASLGFLPMALSNGAGAEVQRPLATVVIGGLLLATFLTLFVLPILYVLFEGKKIKMNAAMMMVILMLFSTHFTQAQQRISLQAALDTALKNNEGLSAESYRVQSVQKLQKTAFTLPNTEVLFVNGQTQSFYQDDIWEFSQRFALPNVYAAQKSVLKNDYKLAQQDFALAKFNLRAEVQKVYLQYLYALEREKMYVKLEQQMSELLKIAQLRLEAGESNILEKSAATQQMAEVIRQLQQIKWEKEISLTRFQVLLGSDQQWVPSDENLRLQIPEQWALENNPWLLKYETQRNLSAARLKSERSKFLPEFMLGYQNMSISGFGNNEQFYPRSARFQAVQIGVGMPLFFGSNLAKTKALKYELKSSELNYIYAQKIINQQQKQLWSGITSLDTVCVYYEKGVLKEADAAQDAAWKQFKQGNINYIEWMLLYRQNIQTFTSYLETVQQYNALLIQYQNFQSITQ